MKKILLVLWSIILIGSLFAIIPFPTHAQSTSENDRKIQELKNKISELEKQLAETRGKENTLKSQLSYIDNQTVLTNLKIEETETQIIKLEQEITDLSSRINKLSVTVDKMTELLLNRIVQTYKYGNQEPLDLLFSSRGFSDLILRTKYLQRAQENDKEVVYQLQATKTAYNDQKVDREERQIEQEKLQKQMKQYQSDLAEQKKAKEDLLKLTQNDEKKYQGLLAQALAEFQAIQSIIAGLGQETLVGDVNQGDSIASIISGKSPCSTGTHLHFEVVKGGAHTNPASYLSPIDVTWSDAVFSFTGNWPWPINGKPIITQGYGMTWYAKLGAYRGKPHTGIDMVADDLSIKTVKNGALYRGSIACGGGILRYVKVDHKENAESTYYLHVNYVK